MTHVALIRADASAEIGAGHVMRCLALADELSHVGYVPVFMSAASSQVAAPALAASGLRIVPPPVAGGEADAARSAGLDRARVAVVDHYGLGPPTEQALASMSDRVVSFDDLPTRAHDADILLDPTPGRHAADYDSLCAPRTMRLMGPAFAQVRRTWRQARGRRNSSAATDGKPRLVVGMGATDPANVTERVLDAIDAIRLDATVDVALGSGAPHLDRVRERCRGAQTLHVDAPDLPRLVAGADLVVGASGSSSFERAVAGVASLVVPVAENQRDLAVSFEREGAADVLPASLLIDAPAFGARIAALMADAPRRRRIAENARWLCDGRGAVRLLCALAGTESARDGGHVSLRAAEVGDSDWLLALQSQPQTRRFARNRAAPTPDEHRAWFEAVLDDVDRILAIVSSRSQRCGFLRLDRLADNAVRYEVSIAIDPALHGRGYGAAALRLARALAPGAVLDAAVSPENDASLSLFRAAGYRHISADLLRSLPQ